MEHKVDSSNVYFEYQGFSSSQIWWKLTKVSLQIKDSSGSIIEMAMKNIIFALFDLT